jgi:hypothetical protein
MRTMLLVVAALFSGSAAVSAEDVADPIVYQLESFGPISTAAEVQTTWQSARESLKDRAGVIVVPASAWPLLKAGSLQSLIRIPEPPEAA